jgi:hypothetical protein
VLLVVAVAALLVVVALPKHAEAEQQFATWRSPQFGLRLSHPTSWNVVEERSDPERGDVVILGNESSALLVGLLHDTRTPRQMADDLVRTQKEQTPDLAVVESSESPNGSIVMFLQYTIREDAASTVLIDEKALVGTLQVGASTITVRAMVPDRADVASEMEEMQSIVATLSSDR